MSLIPSSSPLLTPRRDQEPVDDVDAVLLLPFITSSFLICVFLKYVSPINTSYNSKHDKTLLNLIWQRKILVMPFGIIAVLIISETNPSIIGMSTLLILEPLTILPQLDCYEHYRNHTSTIYVILMSASRLFQEQPLTLMASSLSPTQWVDHAYLRAVVYIWRMAWIAVLIYLVRLVVSKHKNENSCFAHSTKVAIITVLLITLFLGGLAAIWTQSLESQHVVRPQTKTPRYAEPDFPSIDPTADLNASYYSALIVPWMICLVAIFICWKQESPLPAENQCRAEPQEAVIPLSVANEIPDDKVEGNPQIAVEAITEDPGHQLKNDMTRLENSKTNHEQEEEETNEPMLLKPWELRILFAILISALTSLGLYFFVTDGAVTRNILVIEAPVMLLIVCFIGSCVPLRCSGGCSRNKSDTPVDKTSQQTRPSPLVSLFTFMAGTVLVVIISIALLPYLYVSSDFFGSTMAVMVPNLLPFCHLIYFFVTTIRPSEQELALVSGVRTSKDLKVDPEAMVLLPVLREQGDGDEPIADSSYSPPTIEN